MSENRRTKPRKELYWRNHLTSWRSSGLSLAEYSRQAGLSSRSLGYWKRRIDLEQGAGRAAQAVVPVPIFSAGSQEQTSSQPIIIHAWNDLSLEVPADFVPESLEKILRVLGRL